MISAVEIQNKYNKLYSFLREYIWPPQIVDAIADLEISIYQTFPNNHEMEARFNRVKQSCLSMIHDDEELNKAFDDLGEVIQKVDSIYAKLNTRMQGVD